MAECEWRRRVWVFVVDVSGGLSVTGESQFARVRGKLFATPWLLTEPC
jgi:hypothetical protein